MIGKRLLDLRTDADMTQDQLAEKLHLNKHSISSYEREKSEPSDAIKIAIARYFHVSVDYLVGLTDNPAPYGDHSNILYLPLKLPPDAMRSLRDYAAFLESCYIK